MKRCSYCGQEYPDDATVCAIDQTPFEATPLEIAPPKPPKFAIFSEYEIPVSLVVISYFWFLPAACCFSLIAFAILLLVISGDLAWSGVAVIVCGIGLAVGTFFLCLSRGLRRGSPGWRTCALVFIWYGFVATAFSIGRYLWIGTTPDHESVTEFWLGCAFAFVWQVWQYRVLTRPDVRVLFYG